jgi:hypothetical protein
MPPRDVVVEHLAGMTKQLARAVARRVLPVEQAEAAIIRACGAARRTGRLGYDAASLAEILQHVLHQLVDLHCGRMATATGAIVRKLEPLAAIREPLTQLQVNARGINEAREAPLRDWEVDKVVAIVCYRAMNPEAGT